MNKQGKLLLVGGVRPAYVIVDEAHQMGLSVLVADYLADSPCKQLSDETSMANATQPQEVADLIRTADVDGVITGYVDMLLPYVAQACNMADKPFWGDADNIEICIHKEKFKQACEKALVPVVPWKRADENTYEDVISSFPYPLVVKPEDGSGSRGVSRCKNRKEALEACKKAFSFSKNGTILIEKQMPADGEFSAYYMLANGKAYLSAVGDKYFGVGDDGSFYEQGMRFPSAHLQAYLEQADDAMQRFFAQNRMRDGFCFVQGFCDDGRIAIHEIGYRLNGGYSYKLVEHFSGYNQVQELIKYAMSGVMDEAEAAKSNSAFDGIGLIVNVTMSCGYIDRITGLEEIKELPGVINISQMHFTGEKMSSPGTTAQDVAYLHCVGTKEDLEEILAFANERIHVYDETGKDLRHPFMTKAVLEDIDA